jgi:hypothetical protein
LLRAGGGIDCYPSWLKIVRTWRVEAAGPTQLEFEFNGAASFVPSFLPVGDAGDAIARAAIDAARDALSM